MADPRIEQYARLLVETCIDVQPRWQVMVNTTPLARPLYEEVVRQIARRGAYVVPRITFSMTGNSAWANEAPEELLGELPAIERHTYETVDAAIAIFAPENTRDGADIPPERFTRMMSSTREVAKRFLSGDVPWVGCQYPTPALAQDAGMTLDQFQEFLYGACLLDWDEVGQRMQRVADVFDAASTVRVVADGTDITFSIEGRPGKVDAGGANMPGGEVFYSPVEDSAEGVVTFSEYPAVLGGNVADGVRLEFGGGRVAAASAAAGEDFLLATLDADEGARVLGEFGIGCNPGIQRHMKNTLFDEKIYGTVHFAVGAGFPFIGGKNESAVHWDMVKDLRGGGEIHVDGEVVQRDGEWVF